MGYRLLLGQGYNNDNECSCKAGEGGPHDKMGTRPLWQIASLN